MKPALLFLVLFPGLLFAQPAPWDELELVGAARLRFLIWPVYQARLYSDATPFRFPAERPFALELTYLREKSRR